MKVVWTDEALDHLNYWKNNDTSKVAKIKNLLLNIVDTPFKGIGKPEPLQYEYSGLWSRRIDREHRLVYSVNRDVITIMSCQYHYKN